MSDFAYECSVSFSINDFEAGKLLAAFPHILKVWCIVNNCDNNPTASPFAEVE